MLVVLFFNPQIILVHDLAHLFLHVKRRPRLSCLHFQKPITAPRMPLEIESKQKCDIQGKHCRLNSPKYRRKCLHTNAIASCWIYLRAIISSSNASMLFNTAVIRCQQWNRVATSRTFSFLCLHDNVTLIKFTFRINKIKSTVYLNLCYNNRIILTCQEDLGSE